MCWVYANLFYCAVSISQNQRKYLFSKPAQRYYGCNVAITHLRMTNENKNIVHASIHLYATGWRRDFHVLREHCVHIDLMRAKVQFSLARTI